MLLLLMAMFPNSLRLKSLAEVVEDHLVNSSGPWKIQLLILVLLMLILLQLKPLLMVVLLMRC